MKKLFLLVLILAAAAAMQAQSLTATIREKRPAPQGYDTLLAAPGTPLTLHADCFLTAQHFNGTYALDSIPYSPVDSTFRQGERVNFIRDDIFDSLPTQLPFDFVFFGYAYNQAVLGSNGLLSFNTGATVPGSPMPQGLDDVTDGQCHYMFNAPIPNPEFTSVSCNSYNAIYGVYEDLDAGTNYLPANGGFYRTVGGTYPRRYFCYSINQVPVYPAHSNQHNCSTYQIVCYEGTNIIDVHVQRRAAGSATNYGRGIIGIQNTTGTDQESHYLNQDSLLSGLPLAPDQYPSYWVYPQAPGAFAPDNRNGFLDSLQHESWRFTPLGDTIARDITWWQLVEDADGRIVDSLQLASADQVTLQPDSSARYMLRCHYQGANGHWYDLRDTISVGVTVSDNPPDDPPEGIAAAEAAPSRVSAVGSTLVIEGYSGAAVNVYDAAGRLLRQAALAGAPLRLEQLPAGLYLVQIGEAPAEKVVVGY